MVNIPDEDRLIGRLDERFTAGDPASPYFNGPDPAEYCEHGVHWMKRCEDCEEEEGM